MTRVQRQIIGACLAAFLLLLLYRSHRQRELYPLTQPTTSIPELKPNAKASQYPWLHIEIQKLPKVQSASSRPSHFTLARQSAVKEAFKQCWQSYQSLAWRADELMPLSGIPSNELGGWGVTMIDNLDTLWIMGMSDEFKDAVAAVTRMKFRKPPSPQLNTHKANVHILGGLLAAFDLSGDEKLLKKSIELGDMLYAAFDTPNRMPIIHWDTNRASRKEQNAEEKVLTGELGSFVLELTRLSQITGDLKYSDAAQRVMDFFDKQQDTTQLPGLWPVSVNPRAEIFYEDAFTLGGTTAALYKTLPGAYALLGGQMPIYRNMYEKATITAAGHNIFQPMNPEEKNVLLAGNIRVTTEDNKQQTYLEPRIQYQSCFAGGMFALGGALFNNSIHQQIAHKLVDGCIWAH